MSTRMFSATMMNAFRFTMTFTLSVNCSSSTRAAITGTRNGIRTT